MQIFFLEVYMKELYIIIINPLFMAKEDLLYGKNYWYNNVYIYASEKERETMNKKTYYKQSGIVFLLIRNIFLINAVISSIITDQRKNKT